VAAGQEQNDWYDVPSSGLKTVTQLPVDLEVCTLALRLGNATGTGGRELRIGGGGS
jgi:hypothetical protein